MQYTTKKYRLIVGRAATGIYLILKLRFKGKKILVPANICYAAVYPILLSGNIPKFCDVDLETGNISLNIFKNNAKDISAVILPHMYGNPVSDIRGICDYCKNNKILLIEDCASAMGAEIENSIVGSFGDYCVFSTGYSKTVDLGNGGIISSDYDLYLEEELYHTLPLFSEQSEKANAFFSKEYRTFRNSKVPLCNSQFINTVKSDKSINFLYRLSKSFEKELIGKLNVLPDVIRKRKNKSDLYNSLLNFDGVYLREYSYEIGSVPWRYNILVKSEIREKLINLLLKNKVPVSDWYPVVANLFGDEGEYPNARKMEALILNFPLLIPDEEIISISKHINDFFSVK